MRTLRVARLAGTAPKPGTDLIRLRLRGRPPYPVTLEARTFPFGRRPGRWWAVFLTARRRRARR